jgi:site-specific DNA recombinase
MTIAYSGKASDPKSYYVCLSQRSNSYVYSGKERCDARRVPSDLLDAAVYDHLSQLNANPRLIKQYVTTRPAAFQNQNIQTALERLKDREQQLVKQRDTVLRWYRQQMVSEDEAERQLGEIRVRLAELEQNKRKLRSEIEAAAPGLTPSEIVAAIQQHLHKDDVTAADKRAAIRAVLEKVMVARQDDTKARGSRPEIDVDLKFR